METILKFATSVQTEVVRGGCPLDKLFLMDRVTYSDLVVIDLPESDQAKMNTSLIAHKMFVHVVMRRARQSYESRWGWKPEHYAIVQVCFYHWDFEQLLQVASDWLTEWDDLETGEYTESHKNKIRKDAIVRTIKYPQVGRVRHYTNPLQEDIDAN